MRRVVLFDIDGTLISGGPAKDAFCEAMLETFGTTGAVDKVSFAGKTDPQIVRELLTGIGYDDSRIESHLPDLFRRYLGKLEVQLLDRPVDVLPGVPELLSALGEMEDMGLALLTGNIVGGAELKLRSAALWGHFELGSYGSDHEERDELPAIALERARRAWRDTIEPGDAIVVGDTPRDVSCGQREGTRTLAVATGHFSFEQLAETGADHVLEDLSATDEVLALLTA
jgi:phosphoglycolate phosphatase